jgi:hypothetical protein
VTDWSCSFSFSGCSFSWSLLSLRAGTSFVDVQEIARCGSWTKTSPFYPWLWSRSGYCPRRWWPLQCSGKVSPRWWVPFHLYLFSKPQSLRKHTIVPFVWWRLQELPWDSRVTDLRAASAYSYCSGFDLNPDGKQNSYAFGSFCSVLPSVCIKCLDCAGLRLVLVPV